jgi:regulator of replication initiation timing
MSASVTRPEETALFLADRCAELEVENAKLREELRWLKPQLDHAINRRFGMLCGENDKLTEENAKLREAARWRKWPEEEPEKSGRYLVLTDRSTDIGDHVIYWSASLGWATEYASIAYWRPIGPLPGGE